MKTVFVGLSGGVDSAVSAYLLKKQGYNVVGAFIKAWEPDFLPCTGARDRLEAMRVAAHLGIPFVTYDLSEEYKKDVVDYFIAEYREGRTPNPDVMCNRTIKFGAFWQKAKADGADMIATGHYSRVDSGQWTVDSKQNSLNAEGYTLNTSADVEKDQTYFLWTLTEDDLSHSLFPVGGLTKNEVRRLAKEANLPNAERRDSQGLCFLGHVDMRAFLKRYLPTKKGTVQDTEGNVIGEHDGVWFYTLNERYGSASSSGNRLYVVAKDVEKNELTVSESESPVGEKKEYALTAVNAVHGQPGAEVRCLARYRYRGELVPAVWKGGRVFFETLKRVAPGQSVVFYDEKGIHVLGGAIIA